MSASRTVATPTDFRGLRFKANHLQPPPGKQLLETVGQRLTDGGHIELVTGRCDRSSLKLAHVYQGRWKISPKIEHAGITYVPIALRPSIVAATRWPTTRIRNRSTPELFHWIESRLRAQAGIDEESASVLTHFIISTWFVDLLPLSPAIVLIGPTASHGIQLQQLMAAFCRRPLVLATTGATNLLSLPLCLSPTLFMSGTSMTSSLSDFLLASSFAGPRVARKGEVLETRFARLVFLERSVMPPSLSRKMLQMRLPEDEFCFRRIDPKGLQELADEAQGRLLSHRVENFDRVQEHVFSAPCGTDEDELFLSLSASVGDPSLSKALTSPLHEHEERRRAERAGSIEGAIAEALLAAVHRGDSSLQVAKIADQFNALKRSRGENVQHSAETIGRYLPGLGLYTRHTRLGNVLSVTEEVRVQVHQLARDFGVPSATVEVPSCAACGKGGRKTDKK